MIKMKESGVDWIGDIPIDWNLVQTKRYFRNKKQIVGSAVDEYERLALTLNGVVKRSKDDNEGLQPEKFEGYQILCKNEIVFKLIDLENVKTSRVGLSPFTGLVSPAYIVISNNSEDNRFYYYWFMFMYYNEVFNHLGGAGVRSALNAKDVMMLPIPDIALSLQKRIADYLDEKCAKIDAIIEKQQVVIEKLKEYKLSVITEAVTKGLNHATELKNSRLEWANQIPVHWETKKINKIAKTSSGATPLRDREADYFENATIRWVRTLDLNDWFVEDSSEKITEMALNSSSCTIMPENTVCVAMYGGAGTIGKCGMLLSPCSTNQAICSLVCTDKMYPMYMLFQLMALRKYWMKYAVGTRKDPNISQEIVSKMGIILPPVNEQKEIAQILKIKCEKIDDTISSKENLIDKLNAYKKSLIYEVVTGKKEV